MTDSFEYLRHEYVGGSRYRLDVYRSGQREHLELYDLHMLDGHGFAQLVFEGRRREDVDSVVAALGALKEAV